MRKTQYKKASYAARITSMKHLRIYFLPTSLLLLACCLLSACAPGTSLLGPGSWQASTLTKQHIHTLVVDPLHPQVLYAGDEDGAVYRSSDAGQHWRMQGRISTRMTALSSLAMAPSAKTLYALADDGMFTSNDTAQTWQRVNTPQSDLPVDSYTTLVFDAQKHLYLGTLHHGIFTSSDGNQWKASHLTLPTGSAINELAYDTLQNRLWAATSQGVYRSDNEGATWVALNNGLNVTDGVTTIQPAATAGGPVGFVYAGTRHGIFRSTDSGSHWAASGQILQGVPIQHILIDFRSSNAATLYVGTSFGVFRSDDSGKDWSGVGSGLPEHTLVTALAIGADNASQLFAVVDNVYAYPGSGTSITPTRVITFLLVVALFVMLFFIARRGSRRRKAQPQSSGDTTDN